MTLNVQLLNQGFGSYLKNILPDDVATAAGAFSVSMRQIRNIESVPVEKFAQIAQHIETIKGLDLINGTDVPTNTTLAQTGYDAVALGSGPNGTYTASDFYGSMSGLPYGWTNIYGYIKSLQTSSLFDLYRNIYLAVTWEGATGHLNTSAYNVKIQDYIPPDPSAIPPDPGQPRIDDWYYVIDGIVLDDSGGGYSRGGAPAPDVTISPNTAGATFYSLIDTNDSNVPGSFGRVTQLVMVSAGSPVKYNTTSVMQANAPSAPTIPTPTVLIQCPPTSLSGGTNTSAGTSGWPTMNSAVQAYIDQANAEILSISRSNTTTTSNLNSLWNSAGTQLTTEQRSRYYGIPPVPTPRSTYVSQYPISLLTFIDAMPSFSISTEPNMHSQTLEAITDQSTVGGQSIIGMMRQERNQNRLFEVGIQLDNNMPGVTPLQAQKILIANGTLPSITPATALNTDTGSWIIPGVLPEAQPIGYYDNNTDNYILTNTTDQSSDFLGTTTQTDAPVVTTGRIPGNPTSVVDTGSPLEAGALSKNPYGSLVSPQLNANYTSATLSPSRYSVSEAIDEVIKCNCDCWVN